MSFMTSQQTLNLILLPLVFSRDVPAEFPVGETEEGIGGRVETEQQYFI